MVDRYYRGQGRLFLSDRSTAGQPTGGFRFLGNVPELRIRTNTDQLKHQESYTGQRLTDLVIETTKEAMLMMTLESFTKENLAMALYGTATDIATATVSAETQTAIPGRSFPLSKINLTTFTSLTDASATTTYVSGTDYYVDLKSGMVTIPSGSAIATETVVKASYAAGASEQVSAYTSPNKEFWLRFNGLNSAESDSPVIIDVYRARFKPQDEWALIGDDLSSMSLEGDILYDSLQPESAATGKFFKERQAALV
ncbi:MAG: hypothetical protein ACRC11_11005 [Xenococcaceae cyanobacterium]